MARKKYQAEEIVKHLRTIEIERAKGLTQEQAARKIGISVNTLIRWEKEYGGLGIDKVKRLKELEQENARMKRLIADQAIDISILKEVSRGNF